MRRILTVTLFLLIFSQAISAQTGNLTAPKTDYSESLSYKPREFPDKKNSKPKKEKESKKDKQASNNMQSAGNSAADANDTITIPVSVFDASGRFVRDLKQSDFKIFVDGREQEIVSTSVRDEPVNVILLIDTSPSANLRIEEIQNYALAVVERLKPDDKVMVAEFNAGYKVRAELTADRQIITNAVRKIKFDDGTSLYEAVETTFRRYVNRLSGRTAVVLLTDGVDTTSLRAHATYSDSLLAAEESNATVFPVYFDTFDDAQKVNKKGITIPGLTPINIKGSLADDYETGRMYLTDIARLSGGRPHQVKNITDTQANKVDNIGGELRAQYQISFRPTDFSAGQRKQITVRVNRPNLTVQARGSYIVGASAQTGK